MCELSRDELYRALHELRSRGFHAESPWNQIDSPAAWAEAYLHELAHWRTLYTPMRPLPLGDGSEQIQRAIFALNFTERDVNEAMTVAVELHAFSMLGMDITRDQRTALFKYAANGCSLLKDVYRFTRLVQFEFPRAAIIDAAEAVACDFSQLARK